MEQIHESQILGVAVFLAPFLPLLRRFDRTE
jgi:hypothetical protein